MSNHPLPYNQPGWLDYVRFGANGQIPVAPYFKNIANAFNHVATCRRKCIATYSYLPNPVQFTTGTVASPESKWSGYFRTGPATTKIVFRVALPRAAKIGASDEPGVRLSLNSGTYNTPFVYAVLLQDTTAAPKPYEMDYSTVTVDVSVNTTYTWELQGQDNVRVASYEIYEQIDSRLDDSLAGTVDPTYFQVGGDITVAHLDALVNANNNLIKLAGSHLLSGFHTASAISGTYASVYPSGVYAHLEWDSVQTRNRNLDIAWLVDGVLDIAGTSGCEIKTTAGSTPASTQLAEVTGFSTSRGWQGAVTTIDTSVSTGADVTVNIKGDGSATLTIYGFALYIYDAL